MWGETESQNKPKKRFKSGPEGDIGCAAIGIALSFFALITLGGLGLQIIYPNKEIENNLFGIWFVSSSIASIAYAVIRYIIAIIRGELSHGDLDDLVSWIFCGVMFLFALGCLIVTMING